jgi:DNA-binding MarR family transcriptional regulator
MTAVTPSEAPLSHRDDGDQLSVELVARLRMATVRLYRLLRQHADPNSGLSQTLISALATVARCGPVTLGRLAELERVQPPSMTRIVAQLEERGLVVRHVDPADRRIARVRVTPAGTQILDEVRTRRNEYLAARLSELSEDERRALDAALPALEHLAGLQP